ncbi:MAG: SMC-Scp complex subunit ScpB [Chlamydiales bacterium]|nr:SMC-Scp complex subunit ScpB [Chlamydiales bacterium]
MLNLLDVEVSDEPKAPSKDQEVKRIVEALLFASNEALTAEKMKEVISSAYPIGLRELKRLIAELADEYKQRECAFQIDEIAGGYLLRTCEEMGVYVELLMLNKRGEKLSKASMEVLAIIAYRSPITRAEIDAIRGVDSSGTVASLVERGLIEGVGRKEAPGRPIQWGVTKRFLKHFGLKNEKELKELVVI